MLVKSQVKYIQSLSHKKVRDEEAVFVAEGPKIINELLGSGGATAVGIFATAEWINTNKSISDNLDPELLSAISESELERISSLSTPNEVLGIFRKPVFPTTGSDEGSTLILALDNIQDPGNLGTIIRCADWFGVRKIVANHGTADNFSPKVVQSTMASLVRVEVEYRDLAEFLKMNSHMDVYAAALDGQALSGYRSVNKGILVIGNESRGISPSIMSMATHRVTIPRFGQAESLNAAVATGIILSAFRS